MSSHYTPALKITSRGRVVLGIAVALPVLVGSILLASPGANAGSEAGQVEYYTVLSGESLWDIAQTIAPEEDPRVVIDEILSLNSLSSTEVHPGDQLLLPAQY